MPCVTLALQEPGCTPWEPRVHLGLGAISKKYQYIRCCLRNNHICYLGYAGYHLHVFKNDRREEY